ncbi:MAG: AI-2E family transporter, partial [Bacteroidota bacterium]|nr:AI-2E family transporter [Bacteroidota bacterium]
MKTAKPSLGENGKKLLLYSALLLVCLCSFFWGLASAKPFLAPVAIAGLLTMLVLPICVALEKRGITRGWAALVAVLIILIFFGAFTAVIGLQARSIGREWPVVKERLRPQVEQLQ